MKKDIHPKYNHNLTITCSCGNKVVTGSTLEEDIKVDICSKCHPFYTGEQKIVDTDNLVQKYEERVEKAKKMSFRSKREKMAARKQKLDKISAKGSTGMTLKDMLDNAKVSK